MQSEVINDLGKIKGRVRGRKLKSEEVRNETENRQFSQVVWYWKKRERWQYQEGNVGLQKVVIFKIVAIFTCWVTGLWRDLIREKGMDLVRINCEDEDAMMPLSLLRLVPSPGTGSSCLRHTQIFPFKCLCHLFQTPCLSSSFHSQIPFKLIDNRNSHFCLSHSFIQPFLCWLLPQPLFCSLRTWVISFYPNPLILSHFSSSQTMNLRPLIFSVNINDTELVANSIFQMFISFIALIWVCNYLFNYLLLYFFIY